MASIVWTDVTGFYSSLSAVSDSAQTDILAYVNGQLNVAKWGGEDSQNLRMARIFLAGHYGLGAMPGAVTGGSGQVIGETEGGLSRQYASNPAADPMLGSTQPGTAFLGLCRRLPTRVGIVP